MVAVGSGVPRSSLLTEVRDFSSQIRALLWVLREHRRHALLCPCCGEASKFRSFGVEPRWLCPRCGSLARHRLLALFLAEHRELIQGRTVLHFAAEPAIRPLVEPYAQRYISCDIHPRPGQIRIDIERVDLPEAEVDLIICNHVLEHVDDIRALSELRRVLKPLGVLLVMVPIVEGWDRTYEDLNIVVPEERRRLFGQEDHVRYYGRDIRDRIAAAGFDVGEYTAVEPSVSTYGLSRGEKVFVCGASRPEA
jgi:SAM-dependent methyltransferase